MAASGDFRELRALRSRLTGFGGSGFWLTMSRALAETARERIKVSFQESQDPYEKPWKASWHRRGPDKGTFKEMGQILRDTNRLFRSLVPSEINREGFRISTAVKYAAIHNWGGTITLPYQERVLAHQKNGRFMRRSKAERAKKSVRVSFAKYGARSFRMPKRQYMPDGNHIGPVWRRSFFDTARRVVARQIAKGAPNVG